MDAYGTARLAAKDAESAIVARICEDFNLTPVLARAHYQQMARYFADFGQVALRPGELCYLAVASEEPPGKPIVACRKVQVALELATPEDREVLRTGGLTAMRQQRLARLARQAQVQGGLLTVEDLAFLTCSSPATVKRDLAECRANDIAVPTRGQIRDIGPGVSHKAQVVQLYLWGLQFSEIERRTRHSEDSIRRYLVDFRQIAALYARGASIPEIRAATGRSGSVIGEYIAIYERARREFPAAPRLHDLLDPARRRTKNLGLVSHNAGSGTVRRTVEGAHRARAHSPSGGGAGACQLVHGPTPPMVSGVMRST